MNPEPNIYGLTPEGKISMKRKIKIALVINYTIATCILSYTMLQKKDPTMTYVLIGIVIIFIATLVYNLKRTDELIDSEKLEVGGYHIALFKLGKQVKSIRIDEVKKIETTSYGIKLISKDSSYKSLFIGKNFEDFEKIKQLLEERVSD